MIGDGLCKVSRDSGDGRTKEVGGWEEEAERRGGERASQLQSVIPKASIKMEIARTSKSSSIAEGVHDVHRLSLHLHGAVRGRAWV